MSIYLILTDYVTCIYHYYLLHWKEYCLFYFRFWINLLIEKQKKWCRHVNRVTWEVAVAVDQLVK